MNAIRPEWSGLSGGNRLPLLRILGRGNAQVNVQRGFRFQNFSRTFVQPRTSHREAGYSRMDVCAHPALQSVEKRNGPFTRVEAHAIFLLHNRRPNAPDGRAIEYPCPSRVFVSKYLRRKIDKLRLLHPYRGRTRSVRGIWC